MNELLDVPSMPRPMVLIGDRDTPSARVLRRQTFFGELVPEASGAAMSVLYEEDDYESPAAGFSSRRLKGDREWLEGGSARQRRTMSAGGVDGTMSFCPGCGSRYYSGSGLGILSGRLCGRCSARYDRRRAGLEGMGGGNAEATWRCKLKPQTHGDGTAEGGPPLPRAGRGYPPPDERPRSAGGFDGSLNRERTGFVDRGLRRVTHAGNLTSIPAKYPASSTAATAHRDAHRPPSESQGQHDSATKHAGNSEQKQKVGASRGTNDRGRDGHRERDKHMDRDRNRDKARDKGKGRDRDRNRTQDRDRLRDKDRRGDRGKDRAKTEHNDRPNAGACSDNRSKETDKKEMRSNDAWNQHRKHNGGRQAERQWQQQQQQAGSRRQRREPIVTQSLAARQKQDRPGAPAASHVAVSGHAEMTPTHEHKHPSSMNGCTRYSISRGVGGGMSGSRSHDGDVTERDWRLAQRRDERKHRAVARRSRRHITTWPQREVR